MKKRHYYYIEGKDPQNPSKIKFEHRDIECDDTFDDELVMLTFPIRMMQEISTVLSQFGLRNDAEYFYSECREVVSVPEKHVNAQGQGKLTFQSYFHKFPDSILHFFDDALIVVILHPLKAEGGVLRDYNMIGYIHVNDIEFKLPDGKLQKGYYYNILRLSERTQVAGVSIYRRKRIFTTMFGILHDITTRNDMHYVYACMGKENQAIVDALKMNTEKHGKMFETFPMRNNTQVNLLYGSSSAEKKLIDITDNKLALREYYHKLQKSREKYIFDTLWEESNFYNTVERITSSSRSSRVYMVTDTNGKMDAAGLMVNWGDYFHLKLQNPKGLFKVIDSLHLTDKLLHPTLLVGSQQATRTLLKGAAHKYYKENGIKLTVLNAQPGDEHFEIKKSIIEDPFLYFVIYDRPEIFEKMKEDSKDEAGNVRLFIEQIIP